MPARSSRPSRPHWRPHWRPHLRRLLASALLLATGAAAAHDTWFQHRPSDGLLALGTGHQFPKMESPMAAEHLQQQGCAGADGKLQAMQPQRLDGAAQLLQPPAAGPGAALSCWAQSQVFELTLAPQLINVYLNEVRPPPTVLQAWAAMQAQGLPWVERYTKFARIERPGAALAEGASAAAPPPSGLGMDWLLDTPASALRTSAEFGVQLLRDGQPLPDFNVELRFAGSPLGIWRRTDADGRLRLRLPLAGPWLLRAIDLRPSASQPGTWDSRFTTLALELADARRPAAP